MDLKRPAVFQKGTALASCSGAPSGSFLNKPAGFKKLAARNIRGTAIARQ
jgi:hypothetical protein